MRLVLFTTAGNQSFIFASNRLREAVGASFLLWELTTEVVRAAAERLGGVLVQSTSGSSMVVVDDERTAHQLVSVVTTAALDRAPGLTLRGVHIEIDESTPTSDDERRIYEQARTFVGMVPGAAVRAARLPVVAACGSTDLPAVAWYSDRPARADGSEAERPGLLSAEAIAKRAARGVATRRMERLLASTQHGSDLTPRPIGEVFDGVDWMGVVHADANRLGSFFLAGTDVLSEVDSAVGERTVLRLSEDMRWCAENAFGDAVVQVAGLCGRTDDLPVVPLVIGGDDLTALVDGVYALAFTTTYLKSFGRYAAQRPLVAQVARLVGNGRGVTASAGVAIVKPHFPFSTGYRLADELCQSAKRLARDNPGVHALDAHVLLDSSVTNLAAIRASYRVDDGALSATRRPFLVRSHADQQLPRERDWDVVGPNALAVRNARRQGGAGAVLSRSQLHALRAELRTDLDRAQRRLTELARRVREPADRTLLDALAGSPPRVRVDAGVAPVLDLLELAEFARTKVTP